MFIMLCPRINPCLPQNMYPLPQFAVILTLHNLILIPLCRLSKGVSTSAGSIVIKGSDREQILTKIEIGNASAKGYPRLLFPELLLTTIWEIMVCNIYLNLA